MGQGTCSIDGCGKPVLVKSRGWCSAHYTRWVRYGDPTAPVRPYGPKGARQCSDPGCTEPVRAKELCDKHYAESRAARLKIRPCAVAGCKRPWYMRDWCVAHYQRWRTYGNPTDGGAIRRVRGTGLPSNWYSEQRRRKVGPPTPETVEYIAILRGDPCCYCGAPWEHTDHIRAVTRGGTGDWTNLTASCAACNHRKSTHELLTFMLRRL